MPDQPRTVVIGMLGCGIVGSGTLRALAENAAAIERQLGARLVVKKVCVRERPFITHSSISLAMAPLDRYSFPSGHTLHAVAFTWQACAAFPELAVALVLLALSIAASRVVLGLHYPTDVLVGALLGAASGAIGASLV